MSTGNRQPSSGALVSGHVTSPRVVIIGGGFTGAVFAVHLARAATRPITIDVVEPRPAVGGGVAYGSTGYEHRINVPSDRMSVFAEEPLHFSSWLRRSGIWNSDPEAITDLGHHYSRRIDFGAYVGALFAETAAANPSGSMLRHVRDLAVSVSPSSETAAVFLDRQSSLQADRVVITASHAVPSFRWLLVQGADKLGKLIRDPWTPRALADIEQNDTVLLIGAGLTAADAIVSLRAAGHRGRIHALSRRALLPRRQANFSDDVDYLAGVELPQTAAALLRRLRAEVRESEANGADWRAAVDGFRRRLPSYWPTLSPVEKKKMVRHLLGFWDVHRFRMAPQVATLLDIGLVEGWLTFSAGRIDHIGRDGGRFAVAWQPRGGAPQVEPVDAIVNCTGPDGDVRRIHNPLFRSLLAAGHARPHALGFGFEIDRDGGFVDAASRSSRLLRLVGPLARAAVGEVTGVPEASAHARHIADSIAVELAGTNLSSVA